MTKNTVKLQVRTFQCCECGSRNVATKYHGKTNIGHIKDMYCYRCRRTTRQIQTD